MAGAVEARSLEGCWRREVCGHIASAGVTDSAQVQVRRPLWAGTRGGARWGDVHCLCPGLSAWGWFWGPVARGAWLILPEECCLPLICRVPPVAKNDGQ